MPTRRASPPGAALWMIAASLAFTAMAAFTKLAGDHAVPLGQIVFYRGLISMVVVSGYMRMSGVSFATPHAAAAQIRRGAIGFVGVASYLAAITLLPLSTAVTINHTSPLWLALLLLVVHRERPQMSLLVAALAGLGGVVLLLKPTFNASQWPGAAVALLSAWLGAIVALNLRALARLEEPPIRTVFVSVI